MEDDQDIYGGGSGQQECPTRWPSRLENCVGWRALKPVDVVVLASNLPIYDGGVFGDVVARAFRALESGGEMHLIGGMLRDERTGPVDAAKWGMNELICGSFGRARTESECVGYFADAGLVSVEVSEFVPGVLARCVGLKP